MKRLPGLKSLIFIFLLFHPGIVMAQSTAIDTSSYLPLFYTGALDYNLMIAAGMGYSHEIERMILQGADIEAMTEEGATPLVLAVSNNRTEAVKTLLRHGADPNKTLPGYMTPFLIAARSVKPVAQESRESSVMIPASTGIEIIEALIKSGADINSRDGDGVTAITYSAIMGYFDMVDLLLYYGADIEMKSDDGTTPLMAAIWAGYTDIADLLIQNGANMEARDNQGFTPFLIAAQNGDTLVMKILINFGVDINEKNIYNCDAIALAIKSNQENALRFLLEAGVPEGDTAGQAINPYEVAARFDRKKLYKILEQNDVPRKYKPAFYDQMAFAVTAKFNPADYYTGISFIYRGSMKRIGVITGIDTKLFYTRVLVKSSDNLYYQFMDKSSAAYAGISADFPLTNYIFRGNFYLSTIIAAGYFFGNNYPGTSMAPGSKAGIMPGIMLRWSKNNFSILSGIDYMKTRFHGSWPVWLRAGVSYNFLFHPLKVPGKIIRWY